MGFFEFLKQNYIWILVVLILAIVTIIGFFADRRDKKKKKVKNQIEENQETLAPPAMANGQGSIQVSEDVNDDVPKIMSQPTINVNTLVDNSPIESNVNQLSEQPNITNIENNNLEQPKGEEEVKKEQPAILNLDSILKKAQGIKEETVAQEPVQTINTWEQPQEEVKEEVPVLNLDQATLEPETVEMPAQESVQTVNTWEQPQEEVPVLNLDQATPEPETVEMPVQESVQTVNTWEQPQEEVKKEVPILNLDQATLEPETVEMSVQEPVQTVNTWENIPNEQTILETPQEQTPTMTENNSINTSHEEVKTLEKVDEDIWKL